MENKNIPEDIKSQLEQELRTRFELLPKDLQDVIMSDDYPKKLLEIAKEKGLTYEELGILETETTMVIVGITKAEDFRDQLQIQLKKNDPEVDSLVAQVNEKVFAPIRTSLMKISEGKEKQEGGGEEAPTPQVNLPGKEGDVLKDTGIEITPEKQEVPEVGSDPDRKAVLKGIENPPRTIISDKLAGEKPTIPANKTTDHSIQKESPKSDPYREPIE